MTLDLTSPPRTLRDVSLRRAPWVLIALAASVILACVWALEARFQGLTVTDTVVADTPVTLYHAAGGAPRPPVIVAHGFGGSRQMMDQISVSLARQGFFVAALDLPGHGRNTAVLSPDVTVIEGTTQQLVDTVQGVTAAIVARPDTAGRVSFVGHSMATDVVIRAAGMRDDVGGVVAISMYSPAVTDTRPAALLMLSGATERHLRGAALEALQQVAPDAREGQTVRAGDILRRAAVAPYVGHVGVLYAPTSLTELTEWLRAAVGSGAPAPLDQTGPLTGLLLAALALVVWPLSRLLPCAPETAGAVPARTFWLCVVLPAPALLLPTLAPAFGIAGHAAFGTLAAALGAWGLVQCALLWRAGFRPGRPDGASFLVYLVWATLFALALDRYGAAFLPTGGRLWVMAGLLLATVPLMVADALLLHAAGLWRRIVARLALLLTLGAAMALAPTTLGLAFTLLPVLLLFFLVYGSAGRWIGARRGPMGVAAGQALALAWAIAASTPLFGTSALF